MRSSKRIGQIEKRLRQTPPAPWYTYLEGEDEGRKFYGISNLDDDPILFFNESSCDVETADFIVHAKSDIEFLLDEIERLKRPGWWSRLRP